MQARMCFAGQMYTVLQTGKLAKILRRYQSILTSQEKEKEIVNKYLLKILTCNVNNGNNVMTK